jgi:hypothetical protein
MFKYICGMPGNPTFYGEVYQDYSRENLQKLVDLHVNTVLINLAWSRPWIDVVNLEHAAVCKSFPLLSNQDEVEMHRKQLAQRVSAVKGLGLKAFALVGIPRYFDFSKYPPEYGVLKGSPDSTIDPVASPMCIQSPEVMKVYQELLQDFLQHLPDLDGIQIYTYDELAEVCDERSRCPRCAGIPLEDRLPRFLNELYSYLQELKPGMAMWWEPWEVSASQTYKIMPQLLPGIGMACHTTIHEVYFVNQTDSWFRNVAALAREQGRTLIGELFMSGSGEDLGAIASYPCPRLVYNQLRALSQTPGVTGIKEYFGLATQYFSVNEQVMKQFTAAEARGWEDIIEPIARDYSAGNTGALKEMWEYASRALEMLPWELSWVMRFSNYPPYDPSYWGKVRFVDLMKTPWNTPSWLSNRRSYYMVVDSECNFTQATQDDVLKRFDLSLDYLARALRAGKQAQVKENAVQELQRQMEALELLMCYIRCRRHHQQLSALSQLIRDGKGSETAKEKVSSLLTAEIANASQFCRLVKNSNVPYMLDTDKMEQTITHIQAVLIDVHKDVTVWAAEHF